jgi:hypothetical protein
VLDHFQAAEDVALGVGNGLALLGAEHHGDAFAVFADQRLQLEHDAHARADRGVRQVWKARWAAATAASTSSAVANGTRQHLLGGRVDDVAPLGGLGLDPLAVDQQLDLFDLGLLGLRCVHLRLLGIIVGTRRHAGQTRGGV